MEVHTQRSAAPLGSEVEGAMAFDLEMANSFQSERPVICMVGTEVFDSAAEECVFTWAGIASREEEPALMRWFLEHLNRHAAQHPQPRLLTFSGMENDLPWLQERFERYGLAAEAEAALKPFEHLDLQRRYQRRAQHNRISLKRLEEIFGIEREATLASRKVSYILTGMIKHGPPDAPLPSRVVDYLREDVHHLLLIQDRWDDELLSGEHLTDVDYLTQVNSLLRLSTRLQKSLNGKADFKADVATLKDLSRALKDGLEGAVQSGGFEGFTLPELNGLSEQHPDLRRVRKKHKALGKIQVLDPAGGYRLVRQLQGRKGTLAVVRDEGRVLMIRRADHLKRAPGVWGLPGGVLEADESLFHGVERELYEELNLRGRAVGILGVSPSVSREFQLFWMELEVKSLRDLEPHTDEVAEYRWVAPGELEQLQPLIPGAAEGFSAFLGPQWRVKKG